MGKIFDWVIGSFMLIVIIFVFYIMLIYIPVGMYTEAQCLRDGYPKYYVSIGLERYCSNLDGDVTVKVDKAK